MADLLYAAFRRREWSAALRWAAQRWYPSQLGATAARVADGTLTPWADQPEPEETAEELAAAFARGPHGVTALPPPRVEATGVTLTGPQTATTARDQPEPPAQPSEPAQERPVDPGPHPDGPTLDDTPCDYSGCRCCYPYGINLAAVDPAAAAVTEAAQQVVDRWLLTGNETLTRIHRQQLDEAWPQLKDTIKTLVAAVDALTGETWPQTTVGGPDHDGLTGALAELAQREAETPTEPAVIPLADGVHWLGEVASGPVTERCDCGRADHAIGEMCPATKADPEPAGDGPGWSREAINDLAERIDTHGGFDPEWPEQAVAGQLRALLAVAEERDAARAELARCREQLADAATMASTYIAKCDDLTAELATARRDGAASEVERIVAGLEDERSCGYITAGELADIADDIRSGQRDVADSSEPATAEVEHG